MSSNTEVLPLFYDHSNIGKSLLHYWPIKETKIEGPQSIVGLCKKAGLTKCVGISRNFYTFMEAWKNLKAEGIQLCFGLELTMTDDAKIHTPESIMSEHKIVVFAKNPVGYQDLIKMSTACHGDVTNHYYVQRFDWAQLTKYWTDNLTLVIPFWDGFLHRNALTYGANIVPAFPAKPTLFRETGSGVPYASFIESALNRFNAQGEYTEVTTKTIYYATREDFEAYTVLRGIANRGSYNAPNVDFLCSPHFCFQAWEELKK